MSYLLGFGKGQYYSKWSKYLVSGKCDATVFEKESEARKVVQEMRKTSTIYIPVDLLYLDKNGDVIGAIRDI